MNLLELSKKSLFVLLLSLMALVMLPACSTTEEEPAADTGTGVPCEVDMMQPGCTKEDVDM